MISPVLMARAPRSAFCGFFMWLPEPSSSPAPHLEGQRWLSGGMFHPCAAAASGTQNKAAAAVVAMRFMASPLLWGDLQFRQEDYTRDENEQSPCGRNSFCAC